jgi:hypothetical protein
MDEKDSSTSSQGLPGDWVTYDPEKPLYEIRHLCVYLSELRDLTEDEGDSGKKSGPGI